MERVAQPTEVTLTLARLLNEALREEFERRAKLGQTIVVHRDGKPVEVPASEVFKL